MDLLGDKQNCATHKKKKTSNLLLCVPPSPCGGICWVNTGTIVKTVTLLIAGL